MERLDQFIGRQIRKPSGIPGRLLGHLMATEHRALVDWMLDSLTIRPTDRILDVGCGGGMTLKTLAQIAPQGFVAGVDYAPAMVRQARFRNRKAIAAGRMEILHEDVTALSFDTGSFDFVCGVETLYFWDNPLAGLKEVCRVLKPGGRVALVMDISKPAPDASVPEDVADRMGFRVFSGEEIVALLTEAGFVEATFKSIPERAKGWLCGYGTAP